MRVLAGGSVGIVCSGGIVGRRKLCNEIITIIGEHLTLMEPLCVRIIHHIFPRNGGEWWMGKGIAALRGGVAPGQDSKFLT